MAKVTIYTTPSCAYCKMAKKFFEENDVDYEEKDVVDDEAARKEAVEKSGQMGVPVISIGENTVVGFDKKKLTNLLDL